MILQNKEFKIIVHILMFFFLIALSTFSQPQINELCEEVFDSIKVPMLVIDFETAEIVDVNNAATIFLWLQP